MSNNILVAILASANTTNTSINTVATEENTMTVAVANATNTNENRMTTTIAVATNNSSTTTVVCHICGTEANLRPSCASTSWCHICGTDFPTATSNTEENTMTATTTVSTSTDSFIVTINGLGLVSLSQEVFFTDTTRAHGEFKELIQKVLERAGEIMAAPVTPSRGVDMALVERRKFYVNDYMNVEARPKKAMEWLSEIEDLCQKMLQALNWTYVQSWQYIGQEERAQLVWRQLDVHFMALSVYFRDYADYSMNELTLGKVAQIGLVPTSWDLREDKFEFGFETEHGYWQAYDKAECIKLWLAGTLHPEVLVRCSNSYASAQLSPHRALPWAYRPYFR